MNLAIRDIRYNLPRFALTTFGIGLLLMIVIGMAGIYRGLVEDAIDFVNRAGADLWVVQKETRGPFAEISRVPLSLEDRVKSVSGVRQARAFVSHTIQREHLGKPLRMVVQGLSWPVDKGEWLPITRGRPLGQAHFEMLADRLLGLTIGERVRLGKDLYAVVGITEGMVGQGGDGMAFFTVNDALAIQNDLPGEAIRIERDGRRTRAERLDISRTQPQILERAYDPASLIPAISPPSVSAILVDAQDGVDVAALARDIASWGDVSVYTADEERDLLLKGNVDRARRQLGLFRTLLVVISAIIMSLIIYTLTLDKIHDIALLKLMGARNQVIVGLILQQALLLGVIGYGIAVWLGSIAFPRFPRRVILTDGDYASLALVVLAISVASSLIGIWKAMRVDPQKVI